MHTISDTAAETSKNTMTQIELRPGVMAEIYRCQNLWRVSTGRAEAPWSFRLDYCRSGRFLGRFTEEKTACLGAGAVALNVHRFPMMDHVFPLGHYEGLSVIVHEEALAARDRQLLDTLGVDMASLNRRVPPDQPWAVFCSHAILNREVRLFHQALKTPGSVTPEYLWLKWLEIMTLLPDVPVETSGLRYLAHSDVLRIKEAMMRAEAEQYCRLSVDDLIRFSTLSRSKFYELFGEIYGTAPGTFLRDLRLQRAAAALQNGEATILAISCSLGFKNPSKFSSAFQKKFGLLPIDYRKQKGSKLDE